MTTEPNSISEANNAITEKPAELTPLGAPAEAAPPTASTEAALPISVAMEPASKWPGIVEWLLLVLLLVLGFFLGSFVATNSDLWMQLAIGRRLSEGQLQFGVDPFSWATEATATKPATYWVHHGWLGSWLFYQLFQLTGGSGLVLGKAILFTLTLLLLSRIGWQQSTNRWFLVVCLTMAALAISPRLLLHPMVISFAFLAITLFIMDRSGMFALPSAEAQPACVRCVWYLPPLFALWANFDAWFIMGPLVLGLCWLATGLSRWFQHAGPVPGKTVGLVFGASLLACLLNPHHVHIFQLPELAYLVLTPKVPLPDALVAGGRTLNAFRQAEPTFIWTLSSLSPNYWHDPRYGYNIAGIAFFPLLLMGLLAFLVMAFVRPRPGAPVLHFGRFLLWVVFAIMALVLYRLIPFFVIVAAPLTAMTLGEFLRWQQLQTETTAAPQDRGLRMARLASVPFMLLLLFFAWPGWLHGSNDYNSPRRVAWQVRADASLQKAAETLHALKQNNACGNVFNSSFDQMNYCAWFAPDVKCFMDTRFALFADQVAAFIRTHRVLNDPDRPDSNWQEFFKEHNIDQVILSNVKLIYWWVNADQWRQRDSDNRNAVFSWADPATPWPVNTARNDWNRRAFGDIPQEQRPPMQGTMPPEQLGLVDLYVHGSGPQPYAAVEAQLLDVYYKAQHQIGQPFQQGVWQAMFGMLAHVPAVQALPGGGTTFGPSLAAFWESVAICRPRDYGPPALPILMVRAARRAVAENAHDPLSQTVVLQANEQLRNNQEDYWIGFPGGPHPSPLRDRLRLLQQFGSMYNLTQLQPERYENHIALAQYYMQNSFLDLALDHLRLAEMALEIRKNAMTDLPKDFDEKAGKVHDEIRQFERKVQLRQAKFKEQSFGKTPLQRAHFAVFGPFQDEFKDRAVMTQFGLGKKALEILENIPDKSLTGEELSQYMQLYLDLFITMGRSARVAELLRQEHIRKAMPPLAAARFQVLSAGALGDYARMAEGLQEIDTQSQVQTRVMGGVWVASMFLRPTMNSASVFSLAVVQQSQPFSRPFQEPYRELFNNRTLRGIVLLEAGDTHAARRIFGEIMRDAHPAFQFADQAIARRYLELLNEQK